MEVHQRNPTKVTTMKGPVSVVGLLGRLGVNRESVLVIRDGEIVPGVVFLTEIQLQRICVDANALGERVERSAAASRLTERLIHGLTTTAPESYPSSPSGATLHLVRPA